MLAPTLETNQKEEDSSFSGIEDLASRRACVQHLCASRHFHKAPLLSAFLVYVCERYFSAPDTRITEYEIGVQVFRRSTGFDPRQDNIVRTYARLLRKRLEDYYQAEGGEEGIRIHLPKGGYTPTFEPYSQKSIAPRLDSTALPSAKQSQPVDAVAVHDPVRSSLRFWKALSGLLVRTLLVGLAALAFRAWRSRSTPTSASALNALWSQVFSEDKDTFIVPADIGFVIMQQANHRTFTLEEYLGWQASDHVDQALAMSYLKDQSYTSMLSLDTVSSLQRLPEVHPNHFVTRASRALRLEDLQSSNAVLLGSNFSNPWTDLFSRRLNFHFVNEPEHGASWVKNDNPRAGERAAYAADTHAYRHPTYGVVAFLPNLSRKGHVLLIEGLDAAGTQAAVNLLFGDTDAMSAFLKRAIGTGGAMKNFEILVEASSFGYDSRAVDAHIIASRISAD
jgi:hypothetical protein